MRLKILRRRSFPPRGILTCLQLVAGAPALPRAGWFRVLLLLLLRARWLLPSL